MSKPTLAAFLLSLGVASPVLSSSSDTVTTWVMLDMRYESGSTPNVKQYAFNYKTKIDCETKLLKGIRNNLVAVRDEQERLHLFDQLSGKVSYTCIELMLRPENLN